MLAMTEEMNLQMESVRQFCMRVDAHSLSTFNFLQYFRDLGTIDAKSARLRDLTTSERFTYDKILEDELNDRYAVNWQKCL